MQRMFLVVLFLLFIFQGLAQRYIEGRVIRVADGDTFTLVDLHKKKTRVRFFGIDCPEIGQEYGRAAKNYTSLHTLDKVVRVEVKNKDRYGRLVGVVWLDPSTDLNLKLIQAGLAWNYPAYSKSDTYREAEQQARVRKVNIWRLKSPTAPWEFRKLTKKGKR
ncbi:thermonuclease family protein [Sphingobacterium faecale]|uniref:Thermonuclease family protein n=1 Tax=Sphingobacterium faecale TaxID=2803775 RepID=A0ABS1R377_9SPHI|nr:thermonuclease family protein [Sphingobacterium faecale]MBL1409153.1 thermonuclease family protein [Sphingobacterium faecale]